MTTQVLYHYTCGHSVAGIDRLGKLVPFWHPATDRRVIWLTDLNMPLVRPLGLTMITLRCDRTQWRYTVARESPGIWWWPHWARAAGLSFAQREVIESLGMPAHWWVSERPVPVLPGGPACMS